MFDLNSEIDNWSWRVNFQLFSSQHFHLWGANDSFLLQFGDYHLGGSLSWLEACDCPSCFEHFFFHLEQHRLDYFIGCPLPTAFCPISLLVLWHKRSEHVPWLPFSYLAGHSHSGLHFSMKCFLYQAKPLRPQFESARVDTPRS